MRPYSINLPICTSIFFNSFQVLYRLISQKVSPAYWAQLFGGGAKRTIRVETAAAGSHSPVQPQISGGDSTSTVGAEDGSSAGGDQGLLSMATSITKQRVKLNIKVLGVQLGGSQDSQGSGSGGAGGTGAAGQDRQSYREQFVPPEMSIVSKLMTKPTFEAKELQEIDYDSGDDSDGGDDDAFDEEDEDIDPFSNVPPPTENVQHSDPNSYAWCMMRYACVKLSQGVLEKFISMAGIDMGGKTANT